MSKIYIILPILVSLLTFSSHSNGEWTYIGEVEGGNKFYIDYDRIKKTNNYVYVWVMTDLLEPRVSSLSYMSYYKVNCETPEKFKDLQNRVCKDGMGKGECDSLGGTIEWKYPVPNSKMEFVSDTVCSQ